MAAFQKVHLAFVEFYWKQIYPTESSCLWHWTIFHEKNPLNQSMRLDRCKRLDKACLRWIFWKKSVDTRANRTIIFEKELKLDTSIIESIELTSTWNIPPGHNTRPLYSAPFILHSCNSFFFLPFCSLL